jgi:hypothetical protein
MRHIYRTITPAVVHAQARSCLQNVLQWKPYGESVSITDLLDLLLLMAASASSLFAVVKRFFGFSHETASRAVKANLPSADQLIRGLLRSLYDAACLSRQDHRRRWLVAIDTNFVPYYGARTPWVVGGPKKQGTKWFFCYGTAVLLHKNRRYTIALCQVLPKTKPHEIVRALLDQIAEKGLKISSVVLDSGFDSGETLLLLQDRHLAYTMPLRRRGGTRSARNRLFEGRHKQICWTEWYVKDTPRKVRTRTVLWKGGPRTMLFAFQGWNDSRACTVYRQAERQKRLYRQRFGIETSYRQKNQGKATTTSRDPIYRLLLEGLAYLLRQLWVVLTEQIRGTDSRTVWVGSLPMQRLIDWLFRELSTAHHEELSIPIT